MVLSLSLGFILFGCLKFEHPILPNRMEYYSWDEIPLRYGKNWEEIRHLELPHSDLSDADLDKLPPMPRLEFLSMSSGNITRLDHFRKENYPRLASLYLTNTGITDKSMENWKDPPTITKLFLNGAKIKSLDWAYKFPKLKRLNIENTEVESLEGLRACPDLIHVWMGWTSVSDLTPLFNRKDLQYVSIDNLWIPLEHMKDFRKSNPYMKVVQFNPIHF